MESLGGRHFWVYSVFSSLSQAIWIGPALSCSDPNVQGTCYSNSSPSSGAEMLRPPQPRPGKDFWSSVRLGQGGPMKRITIPKGWALFPF